LERLELRLEIWRRLQGNFKVKKRNVIDWVILRSV
jgi:hypothetical protein